MLQDVHPLVTTVGTGLLLFILLLVVVKAGEATESRTYVPKNGMCSQTVDWLS